MQKWLHFFRFFKGIPPQSLRKGPLRVPSNKTRQWLLIWEVLENIEEKGVE